MSGNGGFLVSRAGLEPATLCLKGKGFGFIHLPDGDAVFLHRRDLLNGSLQAGAQITFCLVETERGLRAVDAELIADRVTTL